MFLLKGGLSRKCFTVQSFFGLILVAKAVEVALLQVPGHQVDGVGRGGGVAGNLGDHKNGFKSKIVLNFFQITRTGFPSYEFANEKDHCIVRRYKFNLR